MRKVFLYTKEEARVFLLPDGSLMTPERMMLEKPGLQHFPLMVEVNGNTIGAIQDLSAMRNFYGIDPELNDEDAMRAIEEVINAPPPDPELSPEEIAAAAAVLQALAALPDNPQKEEGE